MSEAEEPTERSAPPAGPARSMRALRRTSSSTSLASLAISFSWAWAWSNGSGWGGAMGYRPTSLSRTTAPLVVIMSTALSPGRGCWEK